jgi:hypothetical protein
MQKQKVHKMLPLREEWLVMYLREGNRLKVTENKEFCKPEKEKHEEITS